MSMYNKYTHCGINLPVSIKPINLKIIYFSLTNTFTESLTNTMVTKINFKRKINDKKLTRRFDDSMSSLSNAKKN